MPFRRTQYIRAALLVGLLACLGWQASRLDLAVVARALRGDVAWFPLLVGLVVFFSAVLLTFIRWWLLVRALGIALPLGQALRLGFVGYFMQFFSLGTVGGDVFKAILVARNEAQHRLEAISTILVDRLLGMLSLILLACLTFSVSGGQGQLPPEFYPLRWVYLILAAAGILVIYLTLYTRIQIRDLVWSRPWRRLVPAASRIDAALGRFRNHRVVVLTAIGMGIVTHGLQAGAIFLAASGVTGHAPSFLQQLCIWPIAAMAGALPLTPAGLGTFDAAYTYLFNWFVDGDVNGRLGLLVAIVFRLYCLFTAGCGVVLYLARPEAYRATLGEERKPEPGV